MKSVSVDPSKLLPANLHDFNIVITMRLPASLKTRLPKQDHLESSVCP